MVVQRHEQPERHFLHLRVAHSWVICSTTDEQAEGRPHLGGRISMGTQPVCSHFVFFFSKPSSACMRQLLLILQCPVTLRSYLQAADALSAAAGC